MILSRPCPVLQYAARVVFTVCLMVTLSGCQPPEEPGNDLLADVPVPAGAAATAASPLQAEPSLPGIEDTHAPTQQRLQQALAAKGSSYRPRTHHLSESGAPLFINRLIFETSPYLLQHAHNPVNWSAWGDEAFERAARQNKPVLLSIGYSTCHWCHVMERESFEDLEIAAFINRHFVAIKVDREERADVDDLYMKAVQILTGRGGWPMTAALTPDRRPFFGGTYFPARDGDRGARKGFLTILQDLSQRYVDNPEGVVKEARELSERVRAAAAPQRPGDIPGPRVVHTAAMRLAGRFDPVWGGFGGAPKFPRPAEMELLLRYHRRSDDEQALEMVLHTLRKMAAGGIHDQVGRRVPSLLDRQPLVGPAFRKDALRQCPTGRLVPGSAADHRRSPLRRRRPPRYWTTPHGK